MSLWVIFATMVGAGLAAVGGGWGTVAVAQQAWVRPGMLEPAMFAWIVGLGNITPGPLTVLVAALGFQLAGLAGAAAAVGGLSLPTWFAASLASQGMQRFTAAMRPVFRAAPWAIAGLVAATGVRLIQPLVPGPWELLGCAVAAVLVGWRRVDPVWVLLAAALVGLVLTLAG